MLGRYLFDMSSTVYVLYNIVVNYCFANGCSLPRAVARTLMGGGGGKVGCLFIYSCSARLVSFQIDKFEFDFKRN